MSNLWINQVHRLNHYRRSTRAVLLVMADMADDEGILWPSYETLARRAGVSRSTAIRAVREMSDKPVGIRVAIERRQTGASEFDSNVYTLVFMSSVTTELPSSTMELPSSTMELPGSTVTPGVVSPGDQGGSMVTLKSSFNPQLIHQLIEDVAKNCNTPLREALARSKIEPSDAGIEIVCVKQYELELLKDRLGKLLERGLQGVLPGGRISWNVMPGG